MGHSRPTSAHPAGWWLTTGAGHLSRPRRRRPPSLPPRAGTPPSPDTCAPGPLPTPAGHSVGTNQLCVCPPVTVDVLFPDDLRNSNHILNLVQHLELIIALLFFFSFSLLLDIFVCAYGDCPICCHKIINPSGCSFPPDQAHDFISVVFLFFPWRRASWGPLGPAGALLLGSFCLLLGSGLCFQELLCSL